MGEFSLQGKTAIITGGSRGIGRAIALRFALAGSTVVVCSRSLDNVRDVADEIAQLGGLAMPFQAHVGRPEDIGRLVQHTIDTCAVWTSW